jgi:hypothetical protein
LRRQYLAFLIVCGNALAFDRFAACAWRLLIFAAMPGVLIGFAA